ncbi:MAG: hypothetical protein QT00_C0002G0017 [archaeon GW2011_AR5]|nr:MAG: hypothetical protein QT00_C0002G0017 [archaeon GW2011_AR5]
MTDRLKIYDKKLETRDIDAYKIPVRIGIYVMTDGPMCDQTGWIG